MRIAAWAFVLAGAGLTLVRFFGGMPPEQGAEGAVAAFAYGAAVAAPGVLALLARRPGTVIAAGIGAMPVAFLASFGVTLPLVIPAVALIVAGGRDQRVDLVTWRTGLADAAAIALPAVAVVALWVHADPREWRVEGGSYGTSDTTTYAEAAVSLSLTAAAVVLSTGTARPCTGPRAGSRGSRPASPSAT